MIIGILSGLAAIIILALCAFVMYYALNNRKKPKHKEVKPSVEAVESVGVAEEDPLNPDIKVSSKKDSKISDSYKHLNNRFKTVGFIIGATITLLATKLFSMQIINFESYKKQANANSTTSVKTPAPRGNIFDTNGKTLVKNRSSLTVLAESDVAENKDTLLKLSVVLGVPLNVIKHRVEDQSYGAQSQRVVASDISHKQAAYISEHSTAFDGVSIQSRTVRDYPYGALAAHVLGYTGRVDNKDLTNAAEGRKIETGDIVGKQGIEAAYDNMLSGDHGERVVVSDADGNIVQIKSEIQPIKGSDVYLTINAAVQSKADKLLADTIAPKGIIGQGKGSAGSVVAMDIEDGSVICMANYPTFKPSILTNGISQDTWQIYNNESSHFPLLNRAISGTYPAASTFKAFTGLAGLKYGYANTSKTWNCTGSWDGWNSGNIQRCWQRNGHGILDFHHGIVVSCDTVFYEIGKAFWDNKETIGETAMQDEISKYNFGQTTGIDISGEQAGRVPTPKWKAEYFKDVPTEARWLGGDDTNMAIGQGYVLITPIQLAVAYAAIASGKIVKPHLLKCIKNDEGSEVIKKGMEVVDIPDVNEKDLKIIKEALHGVGTDPASGVSATMKKFNLDCAVKTGTAEVSGKEDFAWTVAYAPFDKPKYVVSCIVEEGGGGSSAASPIVGEVLKAVLDAKDNKLEDKIEFISGSTGQSVKINKSSSRTD